MKKLRPESGKRGIKPKSSFVLKVSVLATLAPGRGQGRGIHTEFLSC